ncbi:ribosome silencing factor [Sporosarcina thermotolerans]|uniref:Ribosomal silencing factor RsfS n=1 Tax=Sporosarcina thermotolerans TaxID=633404 RepID=A0AAW9A893_9BACL|nr:ribosome silencing factor [Sporosarcina thermotolerans]MDW0117412.1 ribosome silencing factor [Sporosarcina thermotolerans]WHT47549.1 ribosome silencing factor [Sporosarcina thermotolerans]
MTTLLEIAYKAVDDKHAQEIVVLNMEGVSLIADQFIICHANSERQVQAIAREVADKASENNYVVKRVEGLETGRWVLVDLGDVVVHVFHKDERGYYNLEKLWGDAPLLKMANEQ